MEQSRKPEIDPEKVELARDVIHELGFGEHADRIVRYGDQELTIVEGLAHHWDEAMNLDGEALYNRILGYVSLADLEDH